jgi:hypothetical protein
MAAPATVRATNETVQRALSNIRRDVRRHNVAAILAPQTARGLTFAIRGLMLSGFSSTMLCTGDEVSIIAACTSLLGIYLWHRYHDGNAEKTPGDLVQWRKRHKIPERCALVEPQTTNDLRGDYYLQQLLKTYLADMEQEEEQWKGTRQQFKLDE